jgi:16S rRNA (guanine527-N7)-methyltransferase
MDTTGTFDGAQGEKDSLRALLSTALGDAGIEVTDEQLGLLATHLELVIDRNSTINLTRITTPREAAYLHVVDSLLLRGAVDSAPSGPFVDVGTGAGYPGIPLAIVTRRKAMLVDSVKKKIAAVQDFVNLLGLVSRVSTDSCRIEELGRTQRGRYSAVTARAVAQTNVLVEYAAPLLRKDGRLILAKGNVSDEELAAGDRAADICGMRRVSRETFELPNWMGHREVIVYQRVANPRIKLPRNTGMAKHHPLGV